MAQYRLFSLTGLVLSAALLTGCESLPPAEPVTTAVTTDTTTLAAATKPKRIKEVLVIEHVTCDPKRAKELQAEIKQREAERRAKGEAMAEDVLPQERIKQLDTPQAS